MDQVAGEPAEGHQVGIISEWGATPVNWEGRRGEGNGRQFAL